MVGLLFIVENEPRLQYYLCVSKVCERLGFGVKPPRELVMLIRLTKVTKPSRKSLNSAEPQSESQFTLLLKGENTFAGAQFYQTGLHHWCSERRMKGKNQTC